MRRLAQHRARYRWYSPGGGVGNRWSCVKKRAVVAWFNRRHHRWPVRRDRHEHVADHRRSGPAWATGHANPVEPDRTSIDVSCVILRLDRNSERQRHRLVVCDHRAARSPPRCAAAARAPYAPTLGDRRIHRDFSTVNVGFDADVGSRLVVPPESPRPRSSVGSDRSVRRTQGGRWRLRSATSCVHRCTRSRTDSRRTRSRTLSRHHE